MAQQICALSEMPMRCKCFVLSVQGEDKLRLFDLGFSEGSEVMPLYECACGGTKIYLVKRTLIALRRVDSNNILAKEEN